MTMTLIETKTLASAAASIEFTEIPQTYTDLVILFSFRTDSTNNVANVYFNTDTTAANYTNLRLLGGGDYVASSSSPGTFFAYGNRSDWTANTFGNASVYIPNYTSATAKSVSGDAVSENNATTAEQILTAGLWTGTAAINRVFIQPAVAPNFVAGSTISLYGVNKYVDPAPKATGGTISYAGGYTYHTFTGSGTFAPTSALSPEVLLVSGGAGGSRPSFDLRNASGGGGAGGVLALSPSLAVGNYTVLIGAGGAGSTVLGNRGATGSESSFDATPAIGGGAGGATNALSGITGGSGGGGGVFNSAGNGAAGTSGQGNAGGNAYYSSGTTKASGGGGGAGGAGGNASKPSGSAVAGNGGIGTNSYSVWAAATGTGQSGYFAGGGGGGTSDDQNGTGGTGGGGAGRKDTTGTSGLANTGGGAGGIYATNAQLTTGNGGSGIVIVRYVS